MIVIVGKAQVRPEAREEVVAACLQMSAASEAEAGCNSYKFYTALTDPNTFFLFEEWETAAALENHFQQPHTVEFGSRLAGYLSGPMSVKRYNVSSVTDM